MNYNRRYEEERPEINHLLCEVEYIVQTEEELKYVTEKIKEEFAFRHRTITIGTRVKNIMRGCGTVTEVISSSAVKVKFDRTKTPVRENKLDIREI